jgi:hypothetical protein
MVSTAMSRLRLGFSRVAAFVAAVFLWTWFLVQQAVMWIGASTVVDDFSLLVERLPRGVEWLFTTPWYVPAGLATALTAFLMWLAWPRAQFATTAPLGNPDLADTPAVSAPSEAQPPPPVNICYCDFMFVAENNIKIGERWNLHDLYVTKTGEDTWLFMLQFAMPFLPRLISVVSVEEDGRRTDHQPNSHLVRHSERYCIIVVKGLPVPCNVRVRTDGVALSVAAIQ